MFKAKPTSKGGGLNEWRYYPLMRGQEATPPLSSESKCLLSKVGRNCIFRVTESYFIVSLEDRKQNLFPDLNREPEITELKYSRLTSQSGYGQGKNSTHKYQTIQLRPE